MFFAHCLHGGFTAVNEDGKKGKNILPFLISRALRETASFFWRMSGCQTRAWKEAGRERTKRTFLDSLVSGFLPSIVCIQCPSKGTVYRNGTVQGYCTLFLIQPLLYLSQQYRSFPFLSLDVQVPATLWILLQHTALLFQAQIFSMLGAPHWSHPCFIYTFLSPISTMSDGYYPQCAHFFDCPWNIAHRFTFLWTRSFWSLHGMSRGTTLTLKRYSIVWIPAYSFSAKILQNAVVRMSSISISSISSFSSFSFFFFLSLSPSLPPPPPLYSFSSVGT